MYKRQLTPVTEIETDTLIQYMKDAADKWINLSMLIKVAQSAPSFEIESIKYNSTSKTVRIGIAKDEAFSFYYPTSLMALEKQGAELIYFSPLRDTKLPDVDGLIFGGGFPEMFLKELEKNISLRNDIKKQANKGMPIYAECGGLMLSLIHI